MNINDWLLLVTVVLSVGVSIETIGIWWHGGN